MGTNVEWTPKLTVPLTEEQYFSLQKFIPWGLQGKIFSKIIDDLIVILSGKHREKFIAAILSRDIHLQDFIKEARNDT